ncbi:hypothetical protein IHE44_0011068, partial [Lamprotornis superbus]
GAAPPADRAFRRSSRRPPLNVWWGRSCVGISTAAGFAVPTHLGSLKPCPLCDEAKEVLEPYKRRFILQEVDITLPENSAWYDKYKYDIPVFHFNGKFLMKHRVDIQKFEDRLRKLELQTPVCCFHFRLEVQLGVNLQVQI